MVGRFQKIRILYIVYDMNNGALMNWLIGILRRINREQFQVDFIVHDCRPGYFDNEVRKLGAKIICCSNPRYFWSYIPFFKKLLLEYGPYDVIHSNLGNCGFHVYIAKQVGVPLRISHLHTEFFKSAKGWGLRAKLKWLFYRYFNTLLIAKYSTLAFTVSSEAAKGSLGSYLQAIKCLELPCGIELEPFKKQVDSKSVRQELGIPETAFVIGHAGRLEWEKNQVFLIKIAKEVNRIDPNMRLLLIGDGPDKTQLETEAANSGLSHKVIFTGIRSDVPRLMLGAMDVFVFPSNYEGLGLALVEAQAAGLPCFISNNIVNEAVIVEPLVQRLSLHDSPFTWAMAISAVKGIKSESTRADALRTLEKSLFNIDNNVRRLQEIYSEFLMHYTQ